MKLIAVVPAYNEGLAISEVIRPLKQAVDLVVVVDDGSTDKTAELAKVAGAIVIRHKINRGQGAALRTGTEFALKMGAEIVIHIDADGQHDPSCLQDVLKPLFEGQADVVYGSRFLGEKPQGMPSVRRWLLKGAKVFNYLALGIPFSVSDPQSGLRAMTADVAKDLDFRQDRMAHCSEILQMVTRSEWRMIEVPVRVIYSAETLAKGQKMSDAFRIVWQLILGLFQR